MLLKVGRKHPHDKALTNVLACFLLMVFLPVGTWVRFLVWMAIGLVFYFVYSMRKSRLARGEGVEEATPEP